ncbi:MAG: tetratricopeptide repeat protein [Candidatus Omnitrophota bacterium]|nr:tetratricopeptide repeat protein [Candidatus Omnitrophota bacterium]
MPRRSKAQDLLDFEIQFYEKLLTAYPDFLDALLPLGHAYTRRGLYEKGLQVDLRLIKLQERDPLAWYNLACSYSLLGRVEDAVEAVRRSLELGYSDLRSLQRDPDLANLRRSPHFRQLLGSMASAPASQAPSCPPGECADSPGPSP